MARRGAHTKKSKKKAYKKVAKRGRHHEMGVKKSEKKAYKKVAKRGRHHEMGVKKSVKKAVRRKGDRKVKRSRKRK